MYSSLRQFIARLESSGELLRISAEFSPRLEIAEIADRMVKNGGKALLFEQTGTGFPLLINAFASDRRMCLALGIENLEDIGAGIEQLLKQFMAPRPTLIDRIRVLPLLQEVSSWMPRVIHSRGACQEVTMLPPDLGKLPVLTCWPADGGPFITLPAVHTRDPETGIRNLGMYRMQVFGPQLTGMHWHLHKGSANHFTGYKKLGKRMPVTVTLGGDPAYTYAATAPLPENLDEYLFAGFLRKKRVELVKCLTNDLEVPADVDFVIEGYVDPEEELILEGPFGDHTGFYSLADHFPRFHVTCITHRRDAVYPATIVGIPPMEDGWIGKATERIFLTPMKLSVAPELRDIHMPVEGVFHNIVLATIRKSYPGQAVKVMTALWGAGQMMFNKIMAIFDEGTDLTNYAGLAAIIGKTVDPEQDIHFIRGPVDILDHSSRRFAYGSKMGIDATSKALPEETSVDGFVPVPPALREAWMAIDPAIREVNLSLISMGLPVVILFVEKNTRNFARRIAKKIVEAGPDKGLKAILLADAMLQSNPPGDIVWMAANHLDPMRDGFYPERETGETTACLFLDATTKTAVWDDFDRPWPNVIVMDDITIGKIDERWAEAIPAPFVPSPSRAYKPLVSNAGAILREPSAF